MPSVRRAGCSRLSETDPPAQALIDQAEAFLAQVLATPS